MKVAHFQNTLSQRRTVLIAAVFILFGGLHLFIDVFNHYLFKTGTYDYAVYNFAFFDFAHGRVSPCPLYHGNGDIHFLQDHFSLILPMLSPLYWVMAPLFGTYSIILIQWLFVMFGAYATFKLIEKTSGNFLLALAAVFFYFTIYGRFAVHNADSNLVVMASALLPAFFYYFETRRWWAMGLVFFGLLFSREDYPLVLMFFCVMLMLMHRQDKTMWRVAAMLLLISVLVFVLIFAWVIPALETAQKSYNLFNYTALGKTPQEAILYVLSSPWQALKLLFVNNSGNAMHNGVKMAFYFVMFFSGGFMLFYRPVFLVALIPLIAKKMWNDDPHRWSHEYYQGIEVATVLPAFVFMAIANIRRDALRQMIAGLVCVLALETSLHELGKAKQTYFGINRSNVFSADLYTETKREKIIRHHLEYIPDTAAVCASGNIAPHLSFRQQITLFPRIDNSQFLLLERGGNTFPIDRYTYDSLLNNMVQHPDWRILYDGSGLVLLERRAKQ